MRYVGQENPHDGLRVGDIGYVIEDYGDGNCEVEFYNADGTAPFGGIFSGYPCTSHRKVIQAMIINIEKPLRLCLDVVETDKHVPSMRMQIAVDVQQFGHKLAYRGYAWFDCTTWDTFVQGLAAPDTTKVSLVDMGDHFSLTLGVVSGRLELAWEMKKRDTSGAIATATFRSPIDTDTFAHVTLQFKEFERWW